MKSSIEVLKYFLVFSVGSIFSLLVVHTFVIEPQTSKSTEIVKAVISDATKSRTLGAQTVINQCKDLGFAFVPATENSGYLLRCSGDEIEPVDQEMYLELSQSVKQYSSKIKSN